MAPRRYCTKGQLSRQPGDSTFEAVTEASRNINPRVLLVQPAYDDREVYVLYLRYHGVTTLAASSALEAIAIVPSADVIVTGIELAGMTDGLEFLRAVRRAAPRHIPMIVLTAHAHPSDRERAFAAGCDRFLAKPCLPDALLAEIYAVLDGSHATSANFGRCPACGSRVHKHSAFSD